MSEFIKLLDGIAMTGAYRQERDTLINNNVISAQFLPICETFQKDQVDQLLGKSGCESLRIYLGLEEGEVRLVLVGVNEEGEDMLPVSDSALSQEDGDDDDVLDRGVRCPTICPAASVLNS